MLVKWIDIGLYEIINKVRLGSGLIFAEILKASQFAFFENDHATV